MFEYCTKLQYMTVSPARETLSASGSWAPSETVATQSSGVRAMAFSERIHPRRSQTLQLAVPPAPGAWALSSPAGTPSVREVAWGRGGRLLAAMERDKRVAASRPAYLRPA